MELTRRVSPDPAEDDQTIGFKSPNLAPEIVARSPITLTAFALTRKMPLPPNPSFVPTNPKKKETTLMTCRIAIRTLNGNYVTAVNGGGMGEAANKLPIHTDATKIGPWEQFTIKFFADGTCTIQTQTGNFLTAVNGGGIGNPANTDPVHTDQVVIDAWEKFTLLELKPGLYAFQTDKGTYLTAVNGGGMGEPANKLPLHTDATKAGGWEKFVLVPRCCDMGKKK